MAKAMAKDLAPVMRLLEISKQRDISKVREEKILPQLEKFVNEKGGATDRMDAAIEALNKAIDAVNKEMDTVNKIYAEQMGQKSYKLWNRLQHYIIPASGGVNNYNLNGRNYALSREQYDTVAKMDREIYSQVDIKYLTVEAKILLETDFKEIAKVLKDNGILVDENVK